METRIVETPLMLSNTDKIQTHQQHHNLMKENLKQPLKHQTQGIQSMETPHLQLQYQFQRIHLIHPTF